MLTVACFWWRDPTSSARYHYTAEDVYLLRRMVARNLTVEHEFVCVTDRPHHLACRAVAMDCTTHIAGTRFAKLMLFRPDVGAVLGERILCLDLDTVIVGNLDPLVERDEDLVLWRNPNFGIRRRARYNTSIILLRAGARPEFWERFDRVTSPAMLARSWGGTDQAWVSHVASYDEAHWTAADGVYGAGRLGDKAPGAGTELPTNARIVFFPGARQPGQANVQERHPWISEYRH